MKKKKIVKYLELTALKGRLREKKYSYMRISEELNMAITTFSDKVNGFSQFDAQEMSNLADILDIAPDEMARYFFPRMLRDATREPSCT